jgi:hypothetical protein
MSDRQRQNKKQKEVFLITLHVSNPPQPIGDKEKRRYQLDPPFSNFLLLALVFHFLM